MVDKPTFCSLYSITLLAECRVPPFHVKNSACEEGYARFTSAAF